MNITLTKTADGRDHLLITSPEMSVATAVDRIEIHDYRKANQVPSPESGTLSPKPPKEKSMKTCTLAVAQAELAKVIGFSPAAELIFDPSIVPEGGWQGAGQFDEATGITKYAVPADTKPDAEAAYMIFGKVLQSLMPLPPGIFQKVGPMKKGGEKIDSSYIVTSQVEGTFTENVADLLKVAEDHKAKAAAGHPLYNNGIKFGPNLVPMGQLIMDDGTVNTNTVAALYWSSKPFNERQEPA